MNLESDANYRVVNERSLGHKNRQFTMECSLNGIRVIACGGNKKAAKKAAAQKMLDIILVRILYIIYHMIFFISYNLLSWREMTFFHHICNALTTRFSADISVYYHHQS